MHNRERCGQFQTHERHNALVESVNGVNFNSKNNRMGRGAVVMVEGKEKKDDAPAVIE